MNNKKVWITGETFAQKYLTKLGYKIIGTNVKGANAEIDIVAICPQKVLIKELTHEYKSGQVLESSFLAEKKNTVDTLVFVEVKARSTAEFGLPQEAVTKTKQLHIKRAAEWFIKSGKYHDMPVRFDIITILGDKLEHFKSAF